MRKLNIVVVLLLLGCVTCLGMQAFARQLPSRQASSGSVLSGTVQDASGKTLEGVPVSARAESEPIRTTVYTDDAGGYVFPPLHPGHYSVSAQAVGFEFTLQNVEISGGKEAHLNFSLPPAKDFTRQLSAPEWMAALPEDTPEDRRGKWILRNNCTGCHPANWVLQNRFDEQGWTRIIDYMEKTNAYGNRPLPDGPVYSGTIRYFKSELATYLARMRGPGPSPMKFKAFARPRGEAAMVVVTEYDTPNGETGKYVVSNGSDWSDGVPSLYESRGPHDVVTDSNGIAWIAATDNNRTVVRLDSKTGETKDIPLRDPRGNVLGSHGIVLDSKHNVAWFNAGSRLGRIDTETGKVDMIEPPRGISVGGSLGVSPQGIVWASANNGAVRYDPSTHEFSSYRSIDPRASTYGVAADSDGNGWWAQLNIGIVGRSYPGASESSEVVLAPASIADVPFTPADKKVFELSLSTNNTAIPGAQGPRRLSGDDNGHVWVGDWWGNNFSEIDIKTNKVTYYPLPEPCNSPYQICGAYMTAVDKNGMVWGNLQNYDMIARLDPKTGKWTLYPIPSIGTESRFISVDNSKPVPEVWLPEWRTNKVARFQFRTKQELQSLRASSQPRVQ